MSSDLILEDVLFKRENDYKLLKELFETAILDPRENIREKAVVGLYDIFGFSLKRCYIENNNIQCDIGESGVEKTFFISKLGLTYLGDVALPKPFDFGRHIYEIESLYK